VNNVDSNWDTYSSEFSSTETLRDIYVRNADLSDWRRFAELIGRLGYPLSFKGHWTGERFPKDVDELFLDDSNDELTTLRMNVSGVHVHCHFFDESEIELNLDPEEIDRPSRLASVLELMRAMASALDKDVVLTPESCPDDWFFRRRPGSGEAEFRPTGGVFD